MNLNIIKFEELARNQKRLKELRNLAGVKQKEAAKEFGISQGMLSRIESGDVKISCEKLMKMYEYYKRIIKGKESQEKIGELSQRIIAVYEDDEIGKAVKIMKKNDFSQLPVKDKEGKYVGSIDENCLIGINRKEKISKVMKEPFPVFSYNTERKRIEEFFKNNPEVKAIFISKRGTIRGIITRYDLYARKGGRK